MGQVFFRDWTPGDFQDPTYNPVGSQMSLESWQANVPRELPYQPIDFYDNRLSAPEFYPAFVQDYEYTDAIRDDLYPVSDEAYRFAPEQPVRYDVYNQLAQRALSPTTTGQAPTRGVYTGLQDLGYE